jgi:hypothetical protein
MTAPNNLSEREIAQWNQATVGGYDMPSSGLDLQMALQKLSDAREALRELQDQHNSACDAIDAYQASVDDAQSALRHGIMQHIKINDAVGALNRAPKKSMLSLATPAPVAVPAKITRNESTPEARKWWADAEAASAEVATWPDWKRAGINVAEQRDAPVEAPVPVLHVDMPQPEAVALFVQAAYAECARIAESKANRCSGDCATGCSTALAIAFEITQAALRAGVKP